MNERDDEGDFQEDEFIENQDDIGDDEDSLPDATVSVIEEGEAWSADPNLESMDSDSPVAALTDDEDGDARPVRGIIDGASAEPRFLDGSSEVSYRRLIAEMMRIEDEVRVLLEPLDLRRKRKFTGTQRWIELEEDIQEWRYTDRFDEAMLRQLLQLIAQRHHLFARLRFLAATRPTWNS